jgi:hypothetical protein
MKNGNENENFTAFQESFNVKNKQLAYLWTCPVSWDRDDETSNFAITKGFNLSFLMSSLSCLL